MKRVFDSKSGGEVSTGYENEAQIVTRGMMELAKAMKRIGQENNFTHIVTAIHYGLNELGVPETKEARMPYIGILDEDNK